MAAARILGRLELRRRFLPGRVIHKFFNGNVLLSCLTKPPEKLFHNWLSYL